MDIVYFCTFKIRGKINLKYEFVCNNSDKMLNIHNLSISFQGDYLFEEIAFKLSPGDRIGLIGKNGAGKSTLLKILSKELEPDSGQIAADKNLSIGFLKQDIDFVYGRTVLEEAYQAFQDIIQVMESL